MELCHTIAYTCVTTMFMLVRSLVDCIVLIVKFLGY